MARCLIIGPLYRGEEPEWLVREPGDMIICADGGYEAALRYGITPDLLVGDFDSMPESVFRGDCPLVRLPVHKDDTDMVVCLREGRSRGYTRFFIVGALGGRLDHTVSNLQCAYDGALRGEEIWLADDRNRVTVLTPGQYTLDAVPGRYLSLLAWTPEVTGVSLTGAVWELQDAVLNARYPLGASNRPTVDHPELSFREGALLVLWTNG